MLTEDLELCLRNIKLHNCMNSDAILCGVLVGWSDTINFPICTRDCFSRKTRFK